jgi:hypothetical protein
MNWSMTEHDESLEVGIAAGLDVPSAMVLSERRNEPPRRNRNSGCCLILILAVLMGIAGLLR